MSYNEDPRQYTSTKNRLPNPGINPEIMTFSKDLCSILNLNGYESEIVGVLAATKRPMIAAEISNFCSVPRTKIYGTVKKLVQLGLLSCIEVNEDSIELPKTWEWWWKDEKETIMGPKQKAFLKRYFIGISIYGLNVEYIRDVFFNWSTEMFEMKQRVEKVIEYMTEHKNNLLPVLDEM